MFITPPEKTWVPAVIKEYLGHRSYKVQTVDGVVYRRTRSILSHISHKATG